MDSLNSEGIVFKKPKNVVSKHETTERRKKSGIGSAESFDLNILSTFEEPRETIPQRLELYQNYLDILQNHLHRVNEKFNGELHNQLLKFISSSFQLIEKVESVIPIGIVESALSIGENRAIFDFIEEKLKDLPNTFEEKVFVCRVQSGTSSSTKAVFQKICAQLINEELCDDDEENEGSSPCVKGQGISKRGRHFSLFDVKAFLSTMKQKYKIVLILEEVDYFENVIITQILTLMGCAKLPIVFIFGVTHGHFIQNVIPLHSTSEFVLERVYSVSPSERINEFMRRVLFDQINPFRLSGPIISYLESQYKEDSFSIDHIFHSIKLCLRYHFLTGKATFCSYKKSDSYEKRDLQLLEDVLQEINSSEATPRKRIKGKTCTVEDLLDDTINGLNNWQFLLRLLCFFNLRLPDCPLGNSYSSIYASCYEGYTSAKEADENEPFHKFFVNLSSLTKGDFQNLLEECNAHLKKTINRIDVEWAGDIIVHFEQVLSDLSESEKEAKANLENADETKTIKTMKLRKTKSLKELQMHLLEAKRQKEGSSAIHEARVNVTDTLRKLLKKFFPPITKIRYSEIFIFSDLNLLINAVYPANYLQLNEDITCPGYALQCPCCSELDPSSVDAKLPDVCILHKLLSEHTTKKVDLNLIYFAFLSVVQPLTTSRRKSKASSSKDAATASYLIRFRRAVGELQHMGFIKRSKSKPDEVSRLTWW